MEILHFLNVNCGDCTLIQHSTGRNTVIDICNGNAVVENEKLANVPVEFQQSAAKGNFNQKSYPTNPIKYFENIGIKEIFRFILTHPDMDHMDGIEVLFNNFKVINFWDTYNKKKMDSHSNWNGYKISDWNFYQEARSEVHGQTVLRLRAGAEGRYYNHSDVNLSGDGIEILSPTDELISLANENQDYNNISYVLLWTMKNGRKVVIAGDSGEIVWNSILEKYCDKLKNIDVLLAPHHGRKSGGNDEYLDVLNPKVTLFGNADSEHINYDAFNDRKLFHITNNQAGNIMIRECGNDLDIYVSNERFAITCCDRDITLDLEGYYHIKTL